MIANKPAIVVVGYNRPKALERLLRSIHDADYSDYSDISLVISLDKGPSEVRDIASSFLWRYGPKRLIIHEARLGLRSHILSCGDLSQTYRTVIILEDDLVVSPAFYDYAVQSV